MQTKAASKIRENDCVLFRKRETVAVRRVAKVEHDETFATPGEGGDLYRVTFEEREGLAEIAEYAPHVEVDVLDEQDLAAVFTSTCELVKRFVDAAVPPVAASFEELSSLSEDKLREIIEHGKEAST